MERKDTGRRARARGCMLAGAVGDALGAQVEFDDLATIVRRHGPAGVTGYAEPPGRFTDDTQMSLFTAEGLVCAAGDDPSGAPQSVWRAYRRWLHTQGFLGEDSGGWLLGERMLRERRAPGYTCLSALDSGREGRLTNAQLPSGLDIPTVTRPMNDSKGCGSVMRVAPVGLLGLTISETFTLGCQTGALTHGHPSGYLAAGVLAAAIRDLLDGASLPAALDRATAELIRWPRHAEVLRALDAARAMAESVDPIPEAVERLGEGWVAEEALGHRGVLRAGCARCARRRRRARRNPRRREPWRGQRQHRRDRRHLLGAALGEAAIPAEWVEDLEGLQIVLRTADELDRCAGVAGENPPDVAPLD